MTVKRRKFAAAVAMVEVMVAMVVLAIATLGALNNQYHVAKQAKIAQAEITATRTGQLMLEDWKSTGGSTEYDPSTLELGFSSALAIPADFDRGQASGSPLRDAIYSITVDDVPMLIMLTWKDVNQDPMAKTTLRQLSVVVKFGEDPKSDGGYLGSLLGNRPPIIPTAYIRLGAPGG